MEKGSMPAMAFYPHSRQRLPPTPESPSTPAIMPVAQGAIPLFAMTPPESVVPAGSVRNTGPVFTALHVLSTAQAALGHLVRLYSSEKVAQEGLDRAVRKIIKSMENHGKLIISGIGKSGKIGEKAVATMNSLSIHSVFLHPTEALHGDLGIIKPNDILMLVTFSGRTPELLALLPHIPSHMPIICLTAHNDPSTCPLFLGRNPNNTILLPAPIHEHEKISFGVSAPTTSTTVAIALFDALAISVSENLHTQIGSRPAEVFLSNHPGGAIGAAVVENQPPRISDLATMVNDVPILSLQNGHSLYAIDLLRAAVRSPGGWVRTDPVRIIAPRRIQAITDMVQPIQDLSSGDSSLTIEKGDWISITGTSTVEEARHWIRKMLSEPRGKTFLKPGTILGIVDDKLEVSGVVEIEDIVGENFELVGHL